jgi:hypothetical protein
MDEKKKLKRVCVATTTTTTTTTTTMQTNRARVTGGKNFPFSLSFRRNTLEGAANQKMMTRESVVFVDALEALLWHTKKKKEINNSFLFNI